MNRILLISSLVVFCAFAKAQPVLVTDVTGDENIFHAQTKQMNQFFRRFNCEEDISGNAYPKTDPQYRNSILRKVFLAGLFDNETSKVSQELKQEFIQNMTDSSASQFLNFYKTGWYAEITAKVKYKGKNSDILFFLKLKAEDLGYKWIFSNLYFQPYISMFTTDTAKHPPFIHPMSHELDFMNLNKVFNNPANIEVYAQNPYRPSYLSIFFYEIKKSDIKFVSVEKVKFHFFQIQGWYFEVSFLNRKSYNSGWLITNLLKVNADDKQRMIQTTFEE